MRDAHRRAADVAARLGIELEPSFVRSMVMSALCRDEFDEAAATAQRLLSHAIDVGDRALAVEGHYLLGIAAFWGAHLDEARGQFEAVVAGFDGASRARHQDVYGHDPQVVCLSRLANTLWFLGREADARGVCEDGLALADEMAHPLSQGTATTFACILALDLRDHDWLRRLAPRFASLGLRSLPFATNEEAVAGLVAVLEGRAGEGVARARAALDASGGRNLYPGFQVVLGRVLLAAHSVGGDASGGLHTCDRLLALGSTPLWDAELHRARAEFLHGTGGSDAEVGRALAAADAVARHQHAGGHLPHIEATRRRVGAAPSRASL
jgi:hypothetical protein